MKYLIWIPFIGFLLAQLTFNKYPQTLNNILKSGLLPLWGIYQVLGTILLILGSTIFC